MKRNKLKKEKELELELEDTSELLIKNPLHNTLDRITNNGNTIFRKFFGHDIKMMSSFENFVNLMYEPTDPASIGVGRILFGKYYITLKENFMKIIHSKRNNDADRYPRRTKWW